MSDDHEAPEYAAALGDRLRNVRQQQGLSLQDVEAGSGGELKASVVGAYERGERSLSVPRLRAMAAFYNVPIVELLPRTERGGEERSSGSRMCLDLTRLERTDLPGRVTIGRYAENIQVRRGDYNGRVLTLRGDDLNALAAAMNRDPADLRNELTSHGVVQAG